MKRAKILFVKKYNTNAKFITNDYDILREKYDVTLRNIKTKNNIFIIFPLIWEFLYMLFNMWRFKLVFIWFADYHSCLAVFFVKLFGKKSVICAGGYESTYIQEINMGVFTKESISKRIRMHCVTYSLKNCSLILPVDESLIENVNTYIYSDTPQKAPLHDGIKNFIPSIQTKFETIYLGYDSGVFKRNVNTPKEQSVISAGLIVNDDEFKRKGFDLLIEAAKIMPEVKFVLIGLNDEYYSKLSALNLPNVSLYKIVSYETLIEEYSKAKIFAQISMFEGMPSTICEAMLCECIPVGSNVNGIPKIVNQCGFVIQKREINEVVAALKKALASDSSIGAKARAHIEKEFALEKRKIKLLHAIDNLLKNLKGK